MTEIRGPNLFVLFRQIQMFSNVGLHPSKEIWVDGVAQDGGTLVRRRHLCPRRICVTAEGDRDREVLHEDGESSQSTRKDKVEQGPQFLQVVLKRWTCSKYEF